MWIEIAAQITQSTGKTFHVIDSRSISGGCINQTYLISNDRISQRLHQSQDCYFIKLNQPSLVEMFAAEARGLLEIAATETIKAPIPICWGISENYSYLVMEYLDLTTKANPQSWIEMGRRLAMMHRYQISNKSQFGWHRNNTIGSTPQINTWETDWTTFFTTHRLGYQFQLAQQKGGYFPKTTDLLELIPQILANHHPQPSLVHGDLWGGNASFTTAGIPVIFDPATYRGDREVDLAMTDLFGGFPATFYQGYNEVYPLDPGHSQRQNLYNLYHILNHYNLFGESYQSQANSIIDRLLNSLQPGS